MPEIGDRLHTSGGGARIWFACEDCGKERWVNMRAGKPQFIRCRPCAGRYRWANRSAHWRGGRRKAHGYIEVYTGRDDAFFSMAMTDKRRTGGGGYIKEHRLVMAQHLGRSLQPWEVVHHKNAVKDDNRIENLELIPSRGQHNTQIERQLKKQAAQIKELQARITLLEAERVLADAY